MTWPDPYTTTYANHVPGESLTLEKLEAMRAEYAAPPPSAEALEQASFLGFFALGVPCCAGADGLRIRVAHWLSCTTI